MLRMILAVIAVLPAATAFAAPPVWTPDMATSRIGFVASWQNAPVKGVFQIWRADIRFDPADLEGSRVEVEIETASVDTAYADRDVEIRKPDWFASAAFPTATFAAERFRHLDADRYEAIGTLTIKGVAQPMTLPFSLTIDGDSARMTAGATLARLVFSVGEGQWRKTNFIKDEVVIEIEVNANRKE